MRLAECTPEDVITRSAQEERAGTPTFSLPLTRILYHEISRSHTFASSDALGNGDGRR
jgi:hypothetical protein